MYKNSKPCPYYPMMVPMMPMMPMMGVNQFTGNVKKNKGRKYRKSSTQIPRCRCQYCEGVTDEDNLPTDHYDTSSEGPSQQQLDKGYIPGERGDLKELRKLNGKRGDFVHDSWDHYSSIEEDGCTEYDKGIIVTEYHLISNTTGMTVGRLIHNPILNLIIKSMPFLASYYGLDEEEVEILNRDSYIFFPSGVNKSSNNIIPQYLSATWIRALSCSIGVINLTVEDTNIKTKLLPSVPKYTKDDSMNNLIKHLHLSIYSMSGLYINDMRLSRNYIPPQRKMINLEDKIINPSGRYNPQSPENITPGSRDSCYDHPATSITVFEQSKDLSGLDFPHGYGIQVGGSDLYLSHLKLDSNFFNNKKIINDDSQSSAIRTVFNIDLDFNDLYDMIVERIMINDTQDHESVKKRIKDLFDKFELNECEQEVEYQELEATRLSLTSFDQPDPIIPVGKSKISSLPFHINTEIYVVAVAPYCGDHTMKLKLRAERNMNKWDLHEFVPDLCKIKSFHRGPGDLFIGPKLNIKSDGLLNLHSHGTNTHIPPGGLRSIIWHPKEDLQPAIDRPRDTIFKVIGYFNNIASDQHNCMPIENFSNLMIYWVPIPEDNDNIDFKELPSDVYDDDENKESTSGIGTKILLNDNSRDETPPPLINDGPNTIPIPQKERDRHISCYNTTNPDTGKKSPANNNKLRRKRNKKRT